MKKKFFLINSFIVFAFGANAQSLQLQDAVNIALKNSLDIQLAKNRIEADSILNHIGVAGGLPLVTGTLSDNESITSVNQKLNTGAEIRRNNAATNNFGAGVTGSILLYNGGRVVATKKRLGELQLQSKELLNSQVQNILADVMLGYYDVVRQQNYIKTIEQSIEASNKQLDIVKIRREVGLANNADLFQAQIDLNVLQQSKLAQQLVIDQAKAELLRQLTLKADSAITINDTILVDKGVQLENIMNSLTKNADIKAAENQIRINELIVKETAALRYPSVRATTGYNFSRNQAAAGNLLLNQNFGPTVGISVAIPIYNGSAFRRQQEVAKIDVRNAGIQKDILLRDYNAEVVKQFHAYSNTLSQLDTAVQNYQLSEKLLDLALLRFEYKQATIVEVKNAQQSFVESGYRLVNLNFAAKSSEIQLKRLANTLTF
ncbi:TolC family protein [Ferruginibacter sp. HRS2-29]|uniref:TolC family protein n=1 Tax=Ferruginibacter sp. HRS2-29 TaxID=2487334 RepID=UPI0020CE1398|nr:TolC family protein [Ferruginibacter sp. HRS2-29]MCP9753352.1 TolC family protein [Ferruginibacter sp. HRS2-29]